MKKYIWAVVLINFVFFAMVVCRPKVVPIKIESAPIEVPPLPKVEVPKREEDQVTWLIFKPLKNQDGSGTFYADIINHDPDRFRSYGDRSTTAHEITHGINSYLRNKYSPSGRKSNGFYVGGDKAVIIDEPQFRKSQIKEFIPSSLRGDRYNLYVAGQRDWDDCPLYIFDEWVAYVNGSVVAIQDAKEGPAKPGFKNNEVYSCAEFFVYAVAVGMAAEKHDPQYFASNKQFKSFLKWHLERSMRVYQEGQKYAQFQWSPEYYQTLKNGKDGAAIREFISEKLGMNLESLFAK